MKKLYRVDVEFHGGEDFMVLAEDADEAGRIAEDEADLDNAEVITNDSVEVETLEDIPSDWRNSEPIAVDGLGGFSCADWLVEQQQRQRFADEGKPDPRQLSLTVPKEEDE